MNEQAQSDRVLARKKREALALKANLQRRKAQTRQQELPKTSNVPEEPRDE